MKAAAVAGLAVAIGVSRLTAMAATFPATPGLLTLESEVRAVHWSAQSVSFDLAVPDAKGGTQSWNVSGDATAMKALGWTAETVKPGDHIDAVAVADGAAHARLLRVILSDGRAVNADAAASDLVYPPLDAGIVGDATASADPMSGYYGNTVLCQGPTWECHAWFNRDHRFILFSVDQQSDGSKPLRALEGIYWLEKLQDSYFMCFVFDQRPIAPICHSPFHFEKVGDEWETVLPNGIRETKRMVAGHH